MPALTLSTHFDIATPAAKLAARRALGISVYRYADGIDVAQGNVRKAISPVILAMGMAITMSAGAQTTAPTTRRAADSGIISQALKGRPVEAIRVSGNFLVPTSVILNQVRTREQEPFDPATVEEDYKRIYELKRFGNIEAKVEPTETGVTVTFNVVEQKQIKHIFFRGNVHLDNQELMEAVGLVTGESIDPFRIALAKQAIERLYREKNYTYAEVTVNQEALSSDGDLVFEVVEGQKVRVRRIAFDGNVSFSNFRLRGQVKTDYYIWIFRAGQLDFDQLEDDAGSLRKFYEQKGFFDAKVGRKLQFSADQSDVQVTFVIEEGPRYKVSRVTFNGAKALNDKQLRGDLKMVEGQFYDKDIVDRDVKALVRAYSPFGYVYQAPAMTQNPDYLYIEPKPLFRHEAGQVELVFDIHEGKPFRMGRIIVTGNNKTQDKVILREMQVAPGQLYNSSELNDATDRLKGLGFFSAVTMTPVGEEPDSRDVLVEIAEGKTASFQIGAGISSNGGIGAEISYEQRNFDIGNWPASWRDIFSEKSFTGAGQSFRIYIAPSTQGNSAGIRFVDPYLFDQPYIFSNDLYYRQRQRDVYEETRLGDRVSIGRRLGRNWIVFLNGRAEDVLLDNIESPDAERAPEIRYWEGTTNLFGIGPSIRYDTTNRGPVLYKGIIAQAGYEFVGGGSVFSKWTGGIDSFTTLYEDLLDRKTVLALHTDVGYISNVNAPVYELFYAGGMGSIRGFKYRGISPTDGTSQDDVGGQFLFLASAEVSYPIYADMIRGVFFCDSGTASSPWGEPNVASPDYKSSQIYRVAVGFGFRVILPFAPTAPLAVDFGFPVVKGPQDQTQLISFSFGFMY